MEKIILDGNSLTLKHINALISHREAKVELSQKAIESVERSRNFLNQTLKQKQQIIIYGVNTGFGPMASHILSPKQLLELQKNLIYSHAVGLGQPLENDLVLSAMVIRLNTLAKGYSGVSVDLLNQLKIFVNQRIIPLVPEHGAVGTSGDLVQLAHIALGLLGNGRLNFKGQWDSAKKILKQNHLKPYQLKVKEGLSLINGTAMMAGIAAKVCFDAKKILHLAVRSAGMALELAQGFNDSLDPALHALRPHKGQMEVAKLLRELVASSKLTKSRKKFQEQFRPNHELHNIKKRVQDVYSLRCAAQILGPVLETLERTWTCVEIEANSVTDNPVVDEKNQTFLHGGNFHGDYVAQAMDQLKASLIKLTLLSERRINYFLNSDLNKEFPPFLNLNTPGLTLGLQGMQFVATSTTAQSQSLGYPHHLHSIPTNGDNQDVVSMGAEAALFAYKVVDNAYVVLAVEMVTLCQAADYLKAKTKLSKEAKGLYLFVRKYFPAIYHDAANQQKLENLAKALKKDESMILV